MTDSFSPDIIWGYTISDWKRYDHTKSPDENEPPHAFRNSRRICRGKNRRDHHGHLFWARKNFDPKKHRCCPDCIKVLALEKADELEGKN